MQKERHKKAGKWLALPVASRLIPGFMTSTEKAQAIAHIPVAAENRGQTLGAQASRLPPGGDRLPGIKLVTMQKEHRKKGRPSHPSPRRQEPPGLLLGARDTCLPPVVIVSQKLNE